MNGDKLIKAIQRKLELARYTCEGALSRAENVTDDKDLQTLIWATELMLGDIEAMVHDLPWYSDFPGEDPFPRNE